MAQQVQGLIGPTLAQPLRRISAAVRVPLQASAAPEPPDTGPVASLRQLQFRAAATPEGRHLLQGQTPAAALEVDHGDHRLMSSPSGSLLLKQQLLLPPAHLPQQQIAMEPLLQRLQAAPLQMLQQSQGQIEDTTQQQQHQCAQPQAQHQGGHGRPAVGVRLRSESAGHPPLPLQGGSLR